MFRAPTGAGLPSLELMLQDLPATQAQLCRHLEITPRTMQRYQAEGSAPRAVMLALFWETRWGRSAADTEAANFAALHFRRAEIAERQLAALRIHVQKLESSMSDFYGAANGPSFLRA